jgi:Zn-dependent metalloprotease
LIDKSNTEASGLQHAVTQFNSGLKYKDESGALNEHLSDVMGVMIRQAVEKKLANDDNWLVGEKCFLPDQKGTALRNMKNPGTAYKAQFLVWFLLG